MYCAVQLFEDTARVRDRQRSRTPKAIKVAKIQIVWKPLLKLKIFLQEI